MHLKTVTSITAFIASEPTFTLGENGRARLYFRIGQERAARAESGFRQLDPVFADLLLWDRAAERAHRLSLQGLYGKGAPIIACGRLEEVERDWGEQLVTVEQFTATRIGPDGNTTDLHPRSRESASGQDPVRPARTLPSGASVVEQLGLSEPDDTTLPR